MPKADDPYYNRSRVPDALTKDVGITGLTPAEEIHNRERKYSANGSDVRKFSNKLTPDSDPYYGRRQVKAAETIGVGETGLSAAEEYETRERKYSRNGGDIRKFSSKLSPESDPYFSRKKVPDSFTVGIGETGNTAAEDYAVRERKQSVANFSGDPFAIIAGSGHRESISAAVVGASSEATRRRSSAIAPDAARAAANHQSRSGYDGDDKLGPIQSRNELPPVNQDRITSDGPTSYDTSQTQRTTQQSTATSVPSAGAGTEGYSTSGIGTGGYNTSGAGTGGYTGGSATGATGTTGTSGYTSGVTGGNTGASATRTTGTTGTGGYSGGTVTGTTDTTGIGSTPSSGVHTSGGGYTGGADTSNTTTSNTYSTGGYTGGTDTSNTGTGNTYTSDNSYSGHGTYTGGGNYSSSNTYSGTNTTVDDRATSPSRAAGHTSYYSAATQQD